MKKILLLSLLGLPTIPVVGMENQKEIQISDDCGFINSPFAFLIHYAPLLKALNKRETISKEEIRNLLKDGKKVIVAALEKMDFSIIENIDFDTIEVSSNKTCASDSQIYLKESDIGSRMGLKYQLLFLAFDNLELEEARELIKDIALMDQELYIRLCDTVEPWFWEDYKKSLLSEKQAEERDNALIDQELFMILKPDCQEKPQGPLPWEAYEIPLLKEALAKELLLTSYQAPIFSVLDILIIKLQELSRTPENNSPKVEELYCFLAWLAENGIKDSIKGRELGRTAIEQAKSEGLTDLAKYLEFLF
ncbi:hypothetical protein H0X06_00095 [Candidatus Dependentiae bacterium]|nr:hypothetical protein [Candidatus Dependentiae bacterium]